MIARRQIIVNPMGVSWGGTYTRNPVSCAAAVAVTTAAFEEEKILDNVNA